MIAIATGMASKAISWPKFPESDDFPNRLVIKAPANTPVIFINPLPAALCLN